MKKTVKSFVSEMIRLHGSFLRGILKRQSDDVSRGHITLPQYLILDYIDVAGPQKMSQLAHEMNVSLPAVSGIVERLHILGMIKRCLDSSDRRVVRIDLSPKGRKTVRKIRSQRQKLMGEIFGKLTEGERRTYLKIFRKVHDLVHQSRKK